MKIWVDADACPVAIKEILFKASQRTGVTITFVANQYLKVPKLKTINLLQVKSGFDVADNEIIKRLKNGDLVITSDIPLAAEAIEKGGHALSPRGVWYDADSIGTKLNMRDFMDTMRASGIQTGGPPPLSQNNKKEFARFLDRWLTKWQKTTQ